MERYAAARNIAIILVIAAAVYFLPRGDQFSMTVGSAVYAAFGALVAYFAARMYIEHRVALYSLGDRTRALLYGAVAVAVVTITATQRMWQTGAGEVVWFVILGGVVYAFVHIWRVSRQY